MCEAINNTASEKQITYLATVTLNIILKVKRPIFNNSTGAGIDRSL